MFNPVDFLTFVKNLSTTNHHEARVRTIIGRAYYATFLKMREWLKDKGYHFPSGISEPYNHRQVQDYLFQEIQQRGPKDRLHALRQLRNDADYNLNIQLTIKEVQRAIELAESILKYSSI
jgi:uncharacterized protein (UPF0332 family)